MRGPKELRTGHLPLLLICDLFTDAFSVSDYIALNCSIMKGKDVEGNGNSLFQCTTRHSPGVLEPKPACVSERLNPEIHVNNAQKFSSCHREGKVPIPENTRLMLFREVIAVFFSENHAK
jgi:hypothetical protein